LESTKCVKPQDAAYVQAALARLLAFSPRERRAQAQAVPPALHPTPSSWLNLVEWLLRELADKNIRRGSFPSVSDLMIEDYLRVTNDDPAGAGLDNDSRVHPRESPTRTRRPRDRLESVSQN